LVKPWVKRSYQPIRAQNVPAALFKGMLPIARGPLSKTLAGYDLVLVVGAEVWRYCDGLNF
jgi:hypothetical protein